MKFALAAALLLSLTLGFLLFREHKTRVTAEQDLVEFSALLETCNKELEQARGIR
jgi:hypothetical protein